MQATDTKTYVDRVLLIVVRTSIYLVLVMPLVVTRDTFFPFIVGKALYSRSVIEIALGVWILLAVRNASYRPVRSWLLIAFAIYLGVSVLASFTGVSLQRSLWSTYERMQGMFDLAHWFAFAVVLTSVFRTSRDWLYLLNFNLLVSLVMALMGVTLRFGGVVPVYDFLDTGERLSITLGNPTYVGAYMLVNVLIGLGLLGHSLMPKQEQTPARASSRRRRRRRARSEGITVSAVFWWRAFWTTSAALNLWMLELSGTRGAFVGLATAFVAFTVLYVVWGKLKPVKVGAAAVVGGLAALTLLIILGPDTAVVQRLADQNYLIRRAAGTSLNDLSITDRWSSMKFGLEGFAAKPFLGWGPENYVVAWGRYYDAEADVSTTFDQAHNKPMEELTTKGAIGLISYLSLWALMLMIVVSRVRRLGPERDLLTLVMGTAMAGYFVQNLFLFDTPATILQFAVLLAFAVSLDTTYDGPREDSTGVGWTSQALNAVTGRLRIRALATSPALRSPFIGWAGAAVLLAMALGVVFVANIRPYRAASEVVLTARQGITWPQRLDYFGQSISLFPPLANYSRVAMFNTLADNWGTLSDEETEAALAIVEREVLEILGSEPEWWRAYADVARVYQSAAASDPAHVETARVYVEIASALAPEARKVVSVRARQEQIEKAYGVSNPATGTGPSP